MDTPETAYQDSIVSALPRNPSSFGWLIAQGYEQTST